MMRRIALFILITFTGAGARADMVTLRPSAQVENAAAITLGAVAELRGVEAERLADVTITPRGVQADARAWAEVSIDDVRAALTAQKVNWGRISLSGATCVVRFRDMGTVAAPAPSESPAPRVPTEVDLSGPATVRTRIAALLARLYDVTPNDLRLLFDEDDEAFLETSEAGRRIEVQPASTASSSRFAVVVWIYDGDLLIDSRTLRVDLRVRRPVVTLRSELQRGDLIRAEHLSAETIWLEPTGPAPISAPESAIGSMARRRLAAGTMLRVDQLESPILVNRGELVTVHCISGGIVVKAKARARADAREGEMVEMTMDGSKKSFQARIVGPGRAVVNLDQAAVAAGGQP